MATYFGVVHKGETSDFGLSFPDFPGCITAASSLDELDEMGREALRLHIEGMLEDGETLPHPQEYLSVYNNNAHDLGFVAVIMLAAKPRGKRVRVNISLREDDLEYIDGMARQYGMDRSGFMLFAAKKVSSPKSATA